MKFIRDLICRNRQDSASPPADDMDPLEKSYRDTIGLLADETALPLRTSPRLTGLPDSDKPAEESKVTVNIRDLEQDGETAALPASLAGMSQIGRGDDQAIQLDFGDMADVLLAQHGRRSPATQPTAPVTSPQPVLHPQTRAACRHALDQIAAQGARMITILETADSNAPARIMEQAVKQLQWLCDILHDTPDEPDPALDQMRNMAFDATDLVQLMQMEKSGNAVDDAVSLLLQVKRELEAQLAA